MIDSLLFDVLLEIFRLLAGDLTGAYIQNVICAVSQEWKATALASPLLWTRLFLDTATRYPPIPTLELWIKRSARAGLDITFSTLMRAPRFNSKYMFIVTS
jgi:hypothetical protein